MYWIIFVFSHTAAGLPTNLTAVQIGLSSLRVSWTPPATVTGYQVYWSGGGESDSGNMSVGAGDKAVNITSLSPGVTYNITLLVHSDHLPSPIVTVHATLGESCM